MIGNGSNFATARTQLTASRSRRARRSRCRRGFTLLELILVLAVVAIAVGAVAANLGNSVRGRAAADAATQFVAVARWARSQAISDGTTYYIVLNPQQSTFRVMVDEDGAMVEAEGEFARIYTVDDPVHLDTDAPLVNGSPTLTFDASGRGDPARVSFTSSNSDFAAVCETPIDEFHVVKGGGS